ncbi:RtcB family protein [Lentisphaerota bacterium WC36G]|nr:RtcB family protein [Lentisphaerae bacterium WC36]
MEWIKSDKNWLVPVKSWCDDLEESAMKQAINLAQHPTIFKHVALMPDCHVGYGMPIGGVIACKDAVIPNAVGVDIGCGMVAVETSLDAEIFTEMADRRKFLNQVKELIPVGEGASHKEEQSWSGFEEYLVEHSEIAEKWPNSLDRKNLGTLGGGNHFIELQIDTDNKIWLMIHSGSRNLGYKVASFYHKIALELNQKFHSKIPSYDLAFLPTNSSEGQSYIRDMNFALNYAYENRQRMMTNFQLAIKEFVSHVEFKKEVNIHHNYAALEEHFGEKVWVHRKGATSAKKDEWGIISGSMGTNSYIVKGLGNCESFCSCSHGAGRVLGRRQASKTLSVEDCNKAMEGIAFDRWSKFKNKWKKGKQTQNLYDLSEAPLAYKDIDKVIADELDLIIVKVKLRPLGVIKG